MLSQLPPMSNVERQRRFRERNPGYFRKYNARNRALEKAVEARMIESARADAAAAAAPATPPPLQLPAPAELPLFPGYNPIGATLAPAH